ncbi:hypothetical protein QQZ08_002473 [Neonectria magnoliae]|uniref:Clr5 domain-containing protein n=1 Tax=Neonectria magnoliae TaxID=2732573 RepID=A0ABR1IBH4_9HYPO
MVSTVGAGDLAWVYSRNPRAAALSNDDIDLYKEPIRQMYLVDNLSRNEVRRRLDKHHGFSISPDQFSKATNRWGFQKQPRKHRAAPIVRSSVASLGELLRDDDAARSKIARLDVSTVPAPLFSGPTPPTEASKRPRSNESTTGLTDGHRQILGPTCPLPERPTKRCKPANQGQLGEDTTTTITDDEGFGRPTTTPKEHLSLTRSPRPFPIAPPDLSNASADCCNDPSPAEDSSVEVDELCAEYLAACYLSKRAFGYYAKVSIPFKYKSSSTTERRVRMLDLARTAKSPSTRKIALVILESELKASEDPENPSAGEPMNPNEAFLFHRHLARIYSYQHHHAGEVQHHLDRARRFTSSDGMPNPTRLPSLDLWTLHHILDGKEDRSISNELLDMLKYDELHLSLVIQPCLRWCKERLQELLGIEALFNITEDLSNIQMVGMSPVSMSRRRRQWDSLALWAHTSSVFAHLWENLQVNPPSISDEVNWLNEDLLPGTSVTHFLMIICRMIVHESRFFTPFWNATEGSPDTEESATPTDFSTVRTGPCLMAIEVLISQCSASPWGAKRRFATHFCDHHSWAPPTRRESALILKVRTELLECLNSTIEATNRQRSATPMPPTPRIAIFDSTDLQGADGDPLSAFIDCSALEEMMALSTLDISEGESNRNTTTSDPQRSSRQPVARTRIIITVLVLVPGVGFQLAPAIQSSGQREEEGSLYGVDASISIFRARAAFRLGWRSASAGSG